MSYRSLILKLFPRWWNLPSVLSPLAFFCRAKAGISILENSVLQYHVIYVSDTGTKSYETYV